MNTVTTHHAVPRRWAAAIIITPLLLCAVFAAGLAVPVWRQPTLWLLDENHPVEMATFILLLAAGITGFRLVRQPGTAITRLFFAVFSLGLILTAMEEIAWGQFFLKFNTPEAFALINAQNETTLHNIHGLQGHSEYFRLIFGVGGIIGACLNIFPACRRIATPPLLLPSFLIIATVTTVDLYADFHPIRPDLDYALQRFSELIEMIIALSAMLYVWLKLRIPQIIRFPKGKYQP